MCATALALGYAIGRIGCQVSGDGDYGIRSSLPWAMGYPHGTVPTPPGVTRAADADLRDGRDVPAGATGCGSCATACGPGVVFALYLVGSGLERLLVEFIRRNHEVLAGLTAPQLESIGAGDRRLLLARRCWCARRRLTRCALAPPRARPDRGTR